MSEVSYDMDSARALLEDPNCFGTVAHAIFILTFGSDPLYGNEEEDQEPDHIHEVYAKIQDFFQVELHENNKNKLNALMLGMESDIFYEAPEAFVSVCKGLYSGDISDLLEGEMDPLTIPEVMATMWELRVNREDEPPLSPAIEALLQSLMENEAYEDGGDPEQMAAPLKEFGEACISEMAQQFLKLGVDPDIVKHLESIPFA